MKKISIGEAIGMPGRPNANPHHDDAPSYMLNCQSVVVAFELRCRGYDVESRPWGRLASRLAMAPHEAFIDPDTGHHPEVFVCRPDTPNGELKTPDHYARLWQELAGVLDAGKRYALMWDWIGQNSGHIVNIMCQGDGEFMLLDNQTGQAAVTMEAFCEYFTVSHGIRNVAMFQTSGMDISPEYKAVLRPAGTLDSSLMRTLASRISIERPLEGVTTM